MPTEAPEARIATPAEMVDLLLRISEPDEGIGRRQRQLARAALDAVLRAAPIHAPAPAQRRNRLRGSGTPRKLHCHCGRCRWCLDNARWDRIFKEKFHDPSYYGPLAVRHVSTLAD